LRLPVEDTLDRRSARLSRGPRGTGLGDLRARARECLGAPTPTSTKEATGVSEASGNGSVAVEENATVFGSSGRRSGKRAVKRDSPQSRLHRVAPSLPVPTSRVSGHAKWRAKKTFARMGTEPQGSGTRATLGRAPKGLARVPVAALGSDGARVLELERFRSAEVDRTHRRSRRQRALPSASRIRATKLAGIARPAFDALDGDESEPGRCAGHRSVF